MGKANKEIVKEFYDVVINGKNMDAFYEYFREDCTFKIAPYVGIGFSWDTSSSDKIKVTSIAKGGPAEGKLQVGDEIVAAEDNTGKWDSFEELKEIGWGQGKIGTPVKVTIQRDGEQVKAEFTRERIEGFDLTLADVIDNWKHFLTVECPDAKDEIIHIIEEGDLVGVYSIATGTHTEFNRQAIWGEHGFYRLRDGKIVESWGTGPAIEYYTQLGYKVERP